MTALLDTVLICAVITILTVRTELYLTGYPQLGGNGLHIAHLLWGGLLMMVSLGILLAFVVPAARLVAAAIGGIGFGLFIDEVGKFVTSDNNYFFKPTAAIIYCVFIAGFLIVRQLERGRPFTRREYLLNSIDLLKEIPMLRMDEPRRSRALTLLARADQSDPLVPHLAQMLDDRRCGQPRKDGRLKALWNRERARLLGAVDRPEFTRVVVSLVIVWVGLLGVQLVGLISFSGVHAPDQAVLRFGGRITNVPFDPNEKRFVQWTIFVATLIALTFALAGVRRLMRRDTPGGLLLFERALLVAIFFLQVFAFVHSQFAAVAGLVVDLGLFVSVRALLTQESERQPRWDA
jgi:hypothetical protein